MIDEFKELDLNFFTCGEHFLLFKTNFVSVVLLVDALSTFVRKNTFHSIFFINILIFSFSFSFYVYSFGVGVFFR